MHVSDQYDKDFVGQIRNISNIFDLMALCISFLLRKTGRDGFDWHQILQKQNCKPEVNIVLDRYKENRNYETKEESINILKEELKEVLNNNLNLVDDCVFIIIWIDNNIEPDYNTDKTDIYYSLNRQFYDEVRIIPRLRNNWINKFSNEHIDERGYRLFRSPDLTSSLFFEKLICKYIISDKVISDKYNLKIVHLGSRHMFTKKLNKKQTLSFGVFPVLCANFEDYFDVKFYENNTVYTKNVSYFEINGIKPLQEESLKNRYQMALEICKEQKMDFVVFPEMLMSDGIFEDLRYTNSLNSIIFWGSIWKNLVNRCHITGFTGEELCSYDKKAGYEYKKNGKTYIEHLKEIYKEVPYAVIDIEGIARIGICICRDLTFNAAKELHRRIETNILVVPAFSNSKDLYSRAEELAKLNNCIVLVVNSCSAFYETGRPHNDIGFLAAPAKHENSRTVYKEEYGNVKCFSCCALHCNGKFITLDFSKVMDKQGVKTIGINNISI